MTSAIHPTAIISPRARVAADVQVGAMSMIGDDVSVGAGTIIGPMVRIEGPSTIGANNRFIGQCSIGTDPQDLKFGKERTELEIGDENTFREFVTINRGTEGGGGVTKIGSKNFFMAYSHVAHDCIVGSGIIFANAATLAGHVEVGDDATIGAFAAVHQFCRVGDHAFIGGFTVATQDVLPYVKTVGNRPAKTYGINTIGLQRKGFDRSTLDILQKVYRVLTISHLRLEPALQKIEEDFGEVPEARYLVQFIRETKRGVIRR
jgi:UDP-N-acetylglucosamine acyltransferase